MEHYKSRNNDFFHFTNPHDDISQLDDDYYDELQSYDFDDDRSCDFSFHTYRPLGIDQSPPANFQMNKNDSMTNSVEEFRSFDNGALIYQLDNTMKSLCDELQHTIEGIGTQITRIEDKTCTIDNYVENVKNSEERYHGTTHRKLNQMQSILQEVQDGVLFLRDKHEIAETQIRLAKLQISKKVTNNQTNRQQPPASQSSCQIPFTSFINLSQTVSYTSAIPQFPYQETHNTPSYTFPQLTHLKSSRNYKSEFHAKYMPEFANFPSYEISNPPRPQEESSKSNYTYTPVIQTLPHALPTAIELEDESSSVENNNANSVVDEVAKMGFRRDIVRNCVRKLMVNGSPVDLNAVLDSLMKNK